MSEDKTTPEDQTTRTAESESGATRQVGPYRLLQKLGEGGMGEVWEAEQQQPVRRKVALKLIKWGMDTKRVVARFEAERQALALMDHPNVAKVFDAGATDQGRPYFAMELVRGERITRHCDRQRLTTRERLELFMQICEGVQHAHQKGIIHRDIKPSNVLVQVQDKKRVPKIIDFGVAKATQQRLTERTLFTELGQLIGTPEYMSPEQAEMTTEDVDTRTDVYSLGVLLYELLVGTLPFDPKELREAGFDEIRRRIREEEPSKPSARVSTLGDASTDSARKRRTDPSSLARQLSGDLDWITMKSLEKDRVRRYSSPSELAADVDRYLHHEPVVASPPSKSYRMGKFVRRHRVGVGFAATLAVLVVGFTVTLFTTMAIQARRIAGERDRANHEAETATQALDFTTALFEVSNPSKARGNSITAREILDKGAEEIGDKFADQPEVQARMMDTLGRVYTSLGLYDQALPLLEQALIKRREIHGSDHPETLNSMHTLAQLYGEQGRHDDAEALHLEALETQKRVLGDDHPSTLSAMDCLGVLYSRRGHYDKAEALYVETLEAQKRAFGFDHPGTLNSMANLAALYLDQGRYDKAEALNVETLEIQKRVLGDDHPQTLRSIYNLAETYGRQGRLTETESLLLETLESSRRVLGDDHPETLALMMKLANLYSRQGRYDEAEPLYVKTLETQERVLGGDHPDTLYSMGNIAILYRRQGRYDEAQLLYVESLETKKRVLGDDHPETLKSMGNLANLYSRQGRYDEAEPLYLEVLETQRGVLGDDHPDRINYMFNLSILYGRQHRYEEAEKSYIETLEAWKRVFGDDHVNTIGCMNNLALLYSDQGRVREAEELLMETLETQERVLGADHPDRLSSMNTLAMLMAKQGNQEEAGALLRKVLDDRIRVLGGDHPHVGESHYRLSCLSASMGERGDALDHLQIAVILGWADKDILTDSTLDSLRGDPEFEAIVAEVKKRIGEE